MVVFSCSQKCESAYKRGSVVPAIYLRRLLPGGSIVLPSDAKSLRSYLDGQPSVVGIHALSPSATHSAAIADCGRELLPRVLTLTLLIYNRAVIFFCVAAPSRILPVRKRSVLWCPDFPLALPCGEQATDRPAREALFGCKGNQKKFNWRKMNSKLFLKCSQIRLNRFKILMFGAFIALLYQQEMITLHPENIENHKNALL